MDNHHVSQLPDASHQALRVLLIGSGGNGSAVLFGLPYLHQAMIAWGFEHGLDVTVLDDDEANFVNVVRQPFGIGDVGQKKATVLVNRVNLFHGLHWEADCRRFMPSLEMDRSYFNRASWDIVISCVDTKKSRADMHAAFFGNHYVWGNVRYWLDLGNQSDRGQFVLGQPLNAVNRASKFRLPCVTELLPQIMDTTAGEGNLPSCSAAEALERQEPFINNSLAAIALAMLTRLIRYGRIDYHGGFYSAAAGSMLPFSVSPDLWKKQRRKIRTAQKRVNALNAPPCVA